MRILARESNSSVLDLGLEIMNKGDLLETFDSDVEFVKVIHDVRQSYDPPTHDEPSVNPAQMTEEKARIALKKAIADSKEDRTLNNKSCANCSKPRRVQYASSLEKGQHISIPGQKCTKYVKAKRTFKRMYDHHAIVKEIKKVEGPEITMVIISCTKIGEQTGVLEETKEFNLRVNEIYIVDYLFPRYNPDTIVLRAESQLSQKGIFKTYCLFFGNCEHFATWCVVGDSKSFQLQSIAQKIKSVVSGILGVGSSIAKAILRLLDLSADEIMSCFEVALPAVLGVTAGPYLLYCIFMTLVYIWDFFKTHQICFSCFERKLLNLWLGFSAFGITQIITFVIFEFALPLMVSGVGIPVVVVLVLLSIVFQMTVARLRKALWSPFSVEAVKVTNLKQLNIGDVISKRYFRIIEHTSIVTDVKVKNNIPTKGDVKLVHYGLPAFFGKREVVEETFEVDLDKTSIYIFDCKGLSTYPADDVVRRARSRIGETKWGMLSNRSCHFAYWAKVQEYNIASSDDTSEITRPLPEAKSSLFIEEKEVHRREDLGTGDVVILNGTLLGILSSVEDFDNQVTRQFEIDVYTYPSWRVTRKKHVIDLNQDRLYINVYNPALCHPMKKRAQNAQEMENKKGESWTTNGFIRKCIEIK